MDYDHVRTRRRIISVGLLGLLAVVGFDFFLHAGVLFSLYSKGDGFLLDPEVAFRRIPLGYATFAILIVLLEWLVLRLGISGARAGAAFGLKLGFIIWLALAVGLASITTASIALLVGWTVGQTAELGLAGAIIAHGLGRARLRGLALYTILLFVGFVIVGVVLQNVLGGNGNGT